jgi:hypothetical protein
MRVPSAILIASILCLSHGAARAQAPGLTPTSTAQPAEKKTKRYTWQLAVSDALTVGLTAASGSGEIFLGGFLLAPAAIHVANGNVGGALGSLLLRTALPAAGLGIGAATAGDCYDEELFCGLGNMLVGAAIGAGIAIAVDYKLLAVKTLREPERRSRRASHVFRLGAVRANPDLIVSKQGNVKLGLRGTW